MKAVDSNGNEVKIIETPEEFFKQFNYYYEAWFRIDKHGVLHEVKPIIKEIKDISEIFDLNEK